eukprot:COSAG02_NODE_1382_length_12967_cov_9.151694_13_plen_64_part_00
MMVRGFGGMRCVACKVPGGRRMMSTVGSVIECKAAVARGVNDLRTCLHTVSSLPICGLWLSVV